MSTEDTFKKCSTCRAPILFEQKYWACSVSTCNRSKLALYFCSLPCWEAHVPEARHRDAWAEERKAPTRAAYLAEQASTSNASTAQPEASRAAREALSAALDVTRSVVGAAQSEPVRAARIVGAAATNAGIEGDDEVLVVVSKLKKYIREQSGMNTSDGAMGPISDHLRTLCRDAIRHASEDGRKTVMDRDFLPFLHRR